MYHLKKLICFATILQTLLLYTCRLSDNSACHLTKKMVRVASINQSSSSGYFLLIMWI